MQYRPGISGNWIPWTHASTATSATITGLTNGTAYEVRVAAINNVGTGAYVSASATTNTTPGVPTGLSLMPGGELIGASWTAPSNTGGTPITGYSVQYRPGSSGNWIPWTHTSTNTSTTITGLTNGTAYEVRVAAINSVGTGSYTSAASATPAAADTVPGVPDSLSLTAEDTQIAISWTAPSNTGGTPITGYSVQYRPGISGNWTNWTHASTATSATITGLTNGTAYEVRVAAINSVGTGSYITRSETPATIPDFLASLSLTLGDTQIGASWTAPTNNGGSPITGYSVQYRPGISGNWIPWTHASTNTSAAITGLTNGQSYQVQVAAINSQGTGGYTIRSETPSTTPGVPTGLVPCTSGVGQLGVSWTAPTNTGGTPITGYSVQYRPGSSGNWTNWTHASTNTSATITSLANGTAYEVQVAAKNTNGTGAYVSASATTATTPGVPTGLSLTAEDTQIGASWAAPSNTGGSTLTGYSVQYRVQEQAEAGAR